ncbi:hypothetical protein K501DRAFT_193629 [Backusella circina FSU 941]|nr:hypothetical protein K501DRAFT_193629 [Backusella circina FSU 941]
MRGWKKNRCGVTALLWGTLKKREYNTKSLVILTIDEYCTSKVCYYYKYNGMDTVIDVKGVGVLQCKNCKIIWNRNTNAAKNMRTITHSIWQKQGRSTIYKPQSKAFNQHKKALTSAIEF